MDITISLENLRNLLDQQIGRCRWYSEKVFDKSEFKKKIEELENGENIAMSFYEVRDGMCGVEYPDDFQVLQKYLMKDEKR